MAMSNIDKAKIKELCNIFKQLNSVNQAMVSVSANTLLASQKVHKENKKLRS